MRRRRRRTWLGLVVVAALALTGPAAAGAATAPVYTEVAHSGGYYGVTSTPTASGGVYEDMPLSVSAGQLVCGSAWVRTDYPSLGASGSFVVWLIGGSTDNRGAAAYSGLGNLGQWTQLHTCAEATTAQTTVRVQFYPAPGVPAVDMDDVDVHESLAVNGGFEAQGSGWGLWSPSGSNFQVYSSPSAAADPAHSGAWYGATNASQAGGGIYQDVPLSVSAGQLICGSAWVRTEGSVTGASGSFVLWLLGGSTNDSGTASFSDLGDDGDWTQVQTCVEATTAQSTLRIQFYPAVGSPTVEIDDVDVHESLAVNGGFEAQGSGWGLWSPSGSNFQVYSSPSAAADPAHSGAWYGATNASQAGGGIYQDVPLSVSAGQLICGSAWVRTEGSVTGASGSFVLWLLGGSTNDSGTASFSDLGDDGDWTQVQTCVEATTAQSTLRIQFYPAVGSPTVEIDDVDVHESLAANGGFEYGSGPWSTTPNTDSTYDAEQTHLVYGPVSTTPVATTLPVGRGRRVLRVRLRLSWTWRYGVTRLADARIGHFPRRTRLTVSCRGRGCPAHLPRPARGRRAIGRSLRALRGRRFRAGDRLRVVLTAPGWRAERAELVIRYGRLPLVRTLR